MIIGVRLAGGLGNMLFQIAFGESMSKLYGCDVVYTNLLENFNHIKTQYDRSPYADEYLTLFPNVDWKKNQDKLGELKNGKKVPFHYVNIKPENGVDYVGYFQSEKYFYSESFVKKLFEMKPGIEMNGFIKASIHVRRADYLTLSDHHPVQDMVYYQTAIEMLDREGVVMYLLFSDDIPWCKANFQGDNFIFIHSKDYLDMGMMSQCTHNIIANSSLSWWGAYLNPNPDKIVIAPRNWLGPKCHDNPRDIIPPNWITI